MLKVELLMKSHVFLGNAAIIFLLITIVAIKKGNVGVSRVYALVSSVLLGLCSLFGGYWYIRYYPGVRNLLKASEWSWAHRFFMETKEHVFFQVFLLSLFLTILLFRENDEQALRLASRVAWLTIGTAVLVNVFGHFVDLGITLILATHGG